MEPPNHRPGTPAREPANDKPVLSAANKALLQKVREARKRKREDPLNLRALIEPGPPPVKKAPGSSNHIEELLARIRSLEKAQDANKPSTSAKAAGHPVLEYDPTNPSLHYGALSEYTIRKFTKEEQIDRIINDCTADIRKVSIRAQKRLGQLRYKQPVKYSQDNIE